MNFILIIITFLLMEGFTWCIHKYVMHGFLWRLHRDHHNHSTEGFLEKNDYFFLIFALPAVLLIYFGAINNFNITFYIGIGITLYGLGYFFVHDIFIHQRIKFLKNTKNAYLLAIRRAHKQHHLHLSKGGGECFGFLWVPIKYFKMYYFKQLNNSN
jgi:beta-carotene 3-hydroxylase